MTDSRATTSGSAPEPADRAATDATTYTGSLFSAERHGDDTITAPNPVVGNQFPTFLAPAHPAVSD
ncbi:hypothetical protein [Nocardia sp. NPDC058633]|uniref:hypothetical protein n=1 Tax=Nocardia sp. NPDC058633 TaxID=3346568 RepID=UPI00365A2574